MATVVAWRTQFDLAKRLQEAFGGDWRAYSAGWNSAEDFMHQESIFWQYEFGRALFDYVNLSIDAILSCENPLIRGMGMLDRRATKGRISAILKTESHPLVARLGIFRATAEGWLPENTP